ncbi:MAG: GNAT family N-acetyltransferase [Devosia nanyangense]|nr:GNAT family N-acetyltransferase [Devosia nanyangense]
MAVRAAVPTDRMAIARLLRDAHAAGGLPFPFSAPHALALADGHIAAPHLLALVYEGDTGLLGVLLASSQDHPFAAIRYAAETVWWIAPEGRGQAATAMLAAYEAWALEQGCAFAGMAALATFPRAEVIYRRRGYREAETHFLKPLS